MELIVEPKYKKYAVQIVSIFLIIVVSLGLLWWQRRGLPAEASRPLPVAASEGATTDPLRPASQVKLVYSVVVTPANGAFTTDFYLEEAEDHADSAWTGIDGRTDLETYVVQPGDTLWSIADRFGLDIDTLRWSNPALERNPDLLPVNTELLILPVIGAYHTVTEGETIASIAAQYGVAEADVINYPLNNLRASTTLQAGAGLIIPNGRKELRLAAPSLDPDYPLAWPVRGRVTQAFQARHRAIDIGAPYGSDVHAADAGTVVYARWARTGYGFMIIVDHGQGRKTLYSHLKGALVQPGQVVERGQVIGQVGSTGNSTGPHVHFEVRENESRVNPFDFLK